MNRIQEQRLYQQAIELLNRQFKKMGLLPTIGVETEFYTVDKERPNNERAISDEQLSLLKQKIDQELAHLRPVLSLFSNTPIHRLYKEDPPHMYEIATNPLPAEQSVNTTREIAVNVRRNIRKLGQFGTSLGSPTRQTPALQISIGFLLDGKDAFNGAFPSQVHSSEENAIAEHMKPGLSALMLLFAPNATSYDRYHDDSNTAPKKISVALTNKGGAHVAGIRLAHFGASHRIENRLPGADTPVYKAILGTMLAEFDAVNKIAQKDSDGKVMKYESGALLGKFLPWPSDEPIPANIEESAKRFKKSRYLWDILDQLSPGEHIGTRLYDHELKRYELQRTQGRTHI